MCFKFLYLELRVYGWPSKLRRIASTVCTPAKANLSYEQDIRCSSLTFTTLPVRLVICALGASLRSFPIKSCSSCFFVTCTTLSRALARRSHVFPISIIAVVDQLSSAEYVFVSSRFQRKFIMVLINFTQILAPFLVTPVKKRKHQMNVPTYQQPFALMVFFGKPGHLTE